MVIVMNRRHTNYTTQSKKNVIIKSDVQFVEDEAWNGTLDKIINIEDNIPQEENEYFASKYNSNVTHPTP